MSKNAHRGWLRSLWTQPRNTPVRRHQRARLSLEEFEERDCPSNTILLNHVDPTTQIPLVPNWTAMGPAPQLRSVGNLSVSGRDSGIVAITPPGGFSEAVWGELVRQGKLKRDKHGMYELVQEP